MAIPKYDVIVVGSGPGGGIATYVLAKAGLKVALIERGPRLRAGIDYNAHANVYENLDRRLSAGKRGVMSSVWGDYAARDHFTPVGDRPAHGFLPALGGRSLCWAGHSLRFGPLDFKRWPISYDEVAPYYSRAERLMQVHGMKDGLSNLPDGEFEPGVPYRCGEKMLKTGVERLKKQGRKMEFVAQRKAIPTLAKPGGRTVCHYCGHCMKGCEVDSKYTSANTPIPLAMKTGNLTLLTGTMMTRVRMSAQGGRVEGVEVVDREGVKRLDCQALVMACNSVETPRLLLANGIANSSGQVGRNLCSHFGITVVGLFPQIRGRDASNDDGTDYYHSLLTGMYWEQPSNKFEGTYQVQCASGMSPTRLFRDTPGWGSALKRNLLDLAVTHVNMNMQGSLIVSPRKYVDLDTERKDQFGIPLPRVHLRYEENDLAMARDVLDTCQEVILAAKGTVYSKPREITPQELVIDSNHWVGTCRMGTNPKDSVVNTEGRSHDIPNLWINDASVFGWYPEKNPTLTNIALSWRAADRLAERMRKGEV
jgi:choline dehydrogenase-like flavoprotein